MKYLILSLVLVLNLFSLSSLAMTPEEYCGYHAESGAPGDCESDGKCAVIYTNIGTKECKLCNDGGCELVEDCAVCNADGEQKPEE